MPGPVMMGPPTRPQMDSAKQKIVTEKAKAIIEILKGMPVADVGLVFNEAHQIILSETKI